MKLACIPDQTSVHHRAPKLISFIVTPLDSTHHVVKACWHIPDAAFIDVRYLVHATDGALKIMSYVPSDPGGVSPEDYSGEYEKFLKLIAEHCV